MDERDWLARRFEDHRGRLREEPGRPRVEPAPSTSSSV
jgi:hypothetical protein